LQTSASRQVGLRTNNGNSKATAVAGISANSQRTNSAGSIIEEDLISLRANNGGISAKDMYYFFLNWWSTNVSSLFCSNDMKTQRFQLR